MKRLFNRFSLQIKKTLLFGVIFVGCFFFFVAIKDFFSVSVIELRGSNNARGLEPLKKKFLPLISLSQLEEVLYELNPNLQSVIIAKKYPRTLVVEVVKDEIVASLEVSGGFFYLSSHGRVVAKKRERDFRVPLIAYYQKLHFNEHSIGEQLTKKEILFSLFFIQQFSLETIAVDRVDIRSGDMLVLKSQDRTYFLASNKDKDVQIEEFKTLLRRFKVEGVEYTSLDLRFDKPIIKLKTRT